MPLATPIGLNAGFTHGQLATITGAVGSVVKVIDDSEQTAATATEQLNPGVSAGSYWQWVKKGDRANRIALFARQAVGATLTTSPVLKVYGAYRLSPNATTPENNAGVLPNDGTWVCRRLDNQDANASGITLALSSSGTGLLQDGTFAYSDYSDPIDLLDCEYFIVLHSTAANVNSGTVPVYAVAYS